MKGFRVLTVGLAAIASVGAYAVETPKEDKPKKKGEWVFMPYVGRSQTQDSSLTINRPDSDTKLHYANVQWDDFSFEGPIYYGFRATYWDPNKEWLGYGIDFFHYKVYADTSKTTQVTGTLNGNPYNQTEPIRNTISRFSISHGVNFLGLNVMARQQQQKSEDYPSGRFQPFVGLGAGVMINHPESRINGEFFEQYQYGGASWQVLAGFEYRFNPKFGLFFEYKYTDYTPTVDTADNGEGTARLKTSHFVIGTSFRM